MGYHFRAETKQSPDLYHLASRPNGRRESHTFALARRRMGNLPSVPTTNILRRTNHIHRGLDHGYTDPPATSCGAAAHAQPSLPGFPLAPVDGQHSSHPRTPAAPAPHTPPSAAQSQPEPRSPPPAESTQRTGQQLAPPARSPPGATYTLHIRVARVQVRSPTYTAPAVGRAAQTGLAWPSRGKRIRCSSRSGGGEGRRPATAPVTAMVPRRTTDGSMIGLPSQDGCGHHPRRKDGRPIPRIARRSGSPRAGNRLPASVAPGRAPWAGYGGKRVPGGCRGGGSGRVRRLDPQPARQLAGPDVGLGQHPSIQQRVTFIGSALMLVGWMGSEWFAGERRLGAGVRMNVTTCTYFGAECHIHDHGRSGFWRAVYAGCRLLP